MRGGKGGGRPRLGGRDDGKTVERLGRSAIPLICTSDVQPYRSLLATQGPAADGNTVQFTQTARTELFSSSILDPHFFGAFSKLARLDVHGLLILHT